MIMRTRLRTHDARAQIQARSQAADTNACEQRQASQSQLLVPKDAYVHSLALVCAANFCASHFRIRQASVAPPRVSRIPAEMVIVKLAGALALASAAFAADDSTTDQATKNMIDNVTNNMSHNITETMPVNITETKPDKTGGGKSCTFSGNPNVSGHRASKEQHFSAAHNFGPKRSRFG